MESVNLRKTELNAGCERRENATGRGDGCWDRCGRAQRPGTGFEERETPFLHFFPNPNTIYNFIVFLLFFFFFLHTFEVLL